MDRYAASHHAVLELKADGSLLANTKLRSSKYLNNLIERDHRGVKQRIGPMLGFKQFRNAAITIAGSALMHRIRKGQFVFGRLGVRGRVAPAVWNAVLGTYTLNGRGQSARGLVNERRVWDVKSSQSQTLVSLRLFDLECEAWYSCDGIECRSPLP